MNGDTGHGRRDTGDMNHDDHVRLIAPGIDHQGGTWADFGAGWGAFTLALRDLIGPEGEIFAIDRDRSALASLRQGMIRQFPETYLHLLEGDIRQPPELPPLDGIVAANSLHYVDKKQQARTLQLWSTLLKPGGRDRAGRIRLQQPQSMGALSHFIRAPRHPRPRRRPSHAHPARYPPLPLERWNLLVDDRARPILSAAGVTLGLATRQFEVSRCRSGKPGTSMRLGGNSDPTSTVK